MRYQEDKTLKDRIAAAMTAAGIASPAALARKMGVPRQTVYRWVNGEGDKLTPQMLYRLADAVNANARWLAEGPPHSIVRPRHLTPEQDMILAIHAQLPPDLRDEWIKQGNTFVRLSSPVTAGNPYPKTPRR
jgi:transcriptional regulator with XRE-family HTH domain